MSENILPIENINICILGCVSAGKSTILNSLFCQDLSQSKIKRTTMMPLVFIETKDINNELNYTKTENGENLKIKPFIIFTRTNFEC